MMVEAGECEKNMEKLQTAITQTEEKLRFLENIFTFIL